MAPITRPRTLRMPVSFTARASAAMVALSTSGSPRPTIQTFPRRTPFVVAPFVKTRVRMRVSIEAFCSRAMENTSFWFDAGVIRSHVSWR